MTFAVVVVTTDGCAGKKITFVLLSGTFVIEIFVLLIRSKKPPKRFYRRLSVDQKSRTPFFGVFRSSKFEDFFVTEYFSD